MKKLVLTLACLAAIAATFHCAELNAADRVRVGVKYGAFRGSPARSYTHLHIRHGYPLVIPRTLPVWRHHVEHPSYVWRHGDHLHVEPARVYPIHPVYPVYPVAPPVYRIYRR